MTSSQTSKRIVADYVRKSLEIAIRVLEDYDMPEEAQALRQRAKK